MADEKLGVTAETDISIVVPDGDRWRVLRGKWVFVDGYVHKISINGGFETRSGEQFGITATFHTLQKVTKEHGKFYGPIDKMVVINGRLATTARVVDKGELIGIPGTGT